MAPSEQHPKSIYHIEPSVVYVILRVLRRARVSSTPEISSELIALPSHRGSISEGEVFLSVCVWLLVGKCSDAGVVNLINECLESLWHPTDTTQSSRIIQWRMPQVESLDKVYCNWIMRVCDHENKSLDCRSISVDELVLVFSIYHSCERRSHNLVIILIVGDCIH